MDPQYDGAGLDAVGKQCPVESQNNVVVPRLAPRNMIDNTCTTCCRKQTS